jgi:Holliday junction DNA helicase RuvA
MITQVRGRLIDKNPTSVVIDVGGIGLQLNIPVSTYEKLGRRQEEVELLTYLHVREDTLQLFGFATEEERELFLLLTSVSGVGPRLAQGILSGSKPQDLRRDIIDGNTGSLTAISGVGRKTAQRLIVELREKLAGPQPEPFAIPGGVTEGAAPPEYEEAVLAMVSLGYNRATAERAVKIVLRESPGLPVEEVVKRALRGV